MRLRRILEGVICVLMAACTPASSSVAKIRLRIAPPAEAVRTVAFADLDCFFLSVSGVGVPRSLSSGDLGAGVDTSCLDLGQISDLVDAQALLNDGLELEVPAGQSRRIRAMGLVTGGACPPTLTELFSSPLPNLYTMGERTLDLTRDTVVTLNSRLNEAEDELTACTKPPAHYAYAASPASSTLEWWPVSATGGLVEEDRVSMEVGAYNGLCWDPDNRYVVLLFNNSVQLWRSTDGGALELRDEHTPLTEHAKSCTFSLDKRFLFVGAQNAASEVYSFDVHSEPDKLTLKFSLPASVSAFEEMFQLGDHVFNVTTGSLDLFALDTETGQLTIDAPTTTEYSGFAMHPSLPVIYGGETTPVQFRGLVWNENMKSFINLPAITPSVDSFARGCVMPDGSAIYATGNKAGGGNLYRIVLDSAGNFMPGLESKLGYDSNVMSSCVISPQGDQLFLTDTTSEEIRTYRIEADGNLSSLSTVPSSVGAEILFIF